MAPRSSARLRAKRDDIDTNPEAEEPLVELPQSYVEGSTGRSKPRAKKQKTEASSKKTTTAASRIKGRRGALQLIAEMPLELFYEVLKLLGPRDLLSLSRVNHFLRSLVLDRQTALPLWKAAFERVKPRPPACPDDLSLPQYANLLYGRTCFFCKSAVGVKISWTCYVRHCKNCFDEQFIDLESRAVKKSLLDTRVFHVDGRQNRTTFTLKSHYEKHLVIQKRLSGKASYKTYIEEAIEKVTSRRKMYWDFDRWEEELKRAKVYDRFERAESRKEGILERLQKAEWENIKPRLVTKVEELIEESNQIERMDIIRARTKDLCRVYEYYVSHNRDLELLGPQCSDLAKREPFQALVYAPSEEEITEQNFLALLDEIPKAFKSWRRSADKILLHLVEKALNKSKLNTRVLSKAAIIFKCQQCSNLLHHPDVLSHQCDTSKVPYQIQRHEDPNRAWNYRQFTFENEAFRYALKVIKAIGQDVNKVTPDELDKIDARVEDKTDRLTSKTWNHGIGKYQVKSRWVAKDWRRAIFEGYRFQQQARWEKIDESAMDTVRNQELNAWRCRLRKKQCVECTLFKIVDNKVVVPEEEEEREGPLSWFHLCFKEEKSDILEGVGVMDEDATTCPAGHDLSMGTFTHRLERGSGMHHNPFIKNSPKPVEMVTVKYLDPEVISL